MSRASRPASSAPCKQLRIGILVGGKLVEEKLLRTPAAVSIGQSVKNTFAIPAPELPRAWELFAFRNGAYTLRLGEGMDGRLAEGGAVRALAPLEQVRLDERARGKIVIGATTVLFQFVVAPPLAPRIMLPASVRGRLLDRVDLRLAGVLAVSLLAHGAVVGWVQAGDTPIAAEPDDLPERYAKRALQTFPELATPRPVGPDVPVTPVAPPDGPGTPATPATPGQPQKPERPALSPEEQARADAEARAREQAAARGALAIVGARGPDGRFADVTEGKNPGGSLQASVDRAAEEGRGVAVVGGEDVGVRGSSTGEIGIGEKPVIGGPTQDGGGRDVKVGEADIPVDTKLGKPVGDDDPGLSAEDVYAKIRASYYGQVQKCYQDQLKLGGELGGRVDVTITIGLAGSVTAVEVDGFHDGVDACIQALARRWRFDKPTQSAATFQFPLTFQRGK